MLEWTGERYLPWIKDAAIAYEHLHRYAYAARFAKGGKVIDIACGEGYGANMLAGCAAAALGVDIDPAAIAHAGSKYGLPNLEFRQGAATSLPVEAGGLFDLAVCFEAIEHVEDQDGILREVARVLAPDGIFIVSTPNKEVYSDAEENPFHLRELEFEEFRALLQRYFRNVAFLGQRIEAGSSIWPLHPLQGDGAALTETRFVARGEAEFEFTAGNGRPPVYFIAVASNAPLQLPLPASALTDDSNEFLHDKDRQIHELHASNAAQREAISWLEVQLAERTRAITGLDAAIDWQKTVVANLEEGIALQEARIRDLHQKVLAAEGENCQLTGERDVLANKLAQVQASRIWKLYVRLRAIRDRLRGPASVRE